MFFKIFTFKKKKKILLLNRGVFFFLLLHLNVIRMTDAIYDGFSLAFSSRVVDKGIISEQLVRALGADRLN